ncbi:FAD:protein FMN transferase [Glaciimonas immobilis]|uniref:FAD:protein FMN transferase n=1 Tax=Glaciimonas immobilis TaxID=728004 RepID=A0A840RUE0_9BURK|nr:FAD:protein FMN transferase [Glaciimonas immobilis]KAF3996358.1 FAD:protein FMN transferase [Glaciimonas immobilis]MBB5202197.1 thiamine biosynthesis lipoprotein [Glaciimonas immobilis]
MRRRAQPWLGTLVEVTIADPLGDAEVGLAFDAAFAGIAEIHRLMSYHDMASNPGSDVTRINRAAVGTSIAIHSHTAQVMRTALMMHVVTAGVFDICCASKLVEWGYLPAVDGALPEYISGPAALVMEGECQLRKNGKVWVDLGGIAKGYAVDIAIAALREMGIRSACVNAGGDLRAYGDIAYPVLIRDPRSRLVAGFCTELKNAALATSGSYFTQKQVRDQTCSALIDGRNGSPIIKQISASVLAPSCMLADALTKVVLASGNPTLEILQQFDATAFII